jgi:hypothetical protein
MIHGERRISQAANIRADWLLIPEKNNANKTRGAMVGAAANSAANSQAYAAPPPTYPPGYVAPPPY